MEKQPHETMAELKPSNQELAEVKQHVASDFGTGESSSAHIPVPCRSACGTSKHLPNSAELFSAGESFSVILECCMTLLLAERHDKSTDDTECGIK